MAQRTPGLAASPFSSTLRAGPAARRTFTTNRRVDTAGRTVVVLTPTNNTRPHNPQVSPLLEEAGCRPSVVLTTHCGHAAELAAAIDLSSTDALLIVSGDGLLSEARRDPPSFPGGQSPAESHIVRLIRAARSPPRRFSTGSSATRSGTPPSGCPWASSPRARATPSPSPSSTPRARRAPRSAPRSPSPAGGGSPWT